LEIEMRLLVVGAGATGGYFGGRLAQAGRDVTFLVREGRAAQLRAKGLQAISPHGDFHITPKLAYAGALDGVYDAIFLSVKAYALENALDDLAPAAGPDTLIFPVLNGMKHMDVLAARFGPHAVIGGLCRIPAHLDEEGRVVQLGTFQDVVYGERNGRRTARIERLDAFMQGAGFDAKLSDAIEREMWEKWVMLASLAGITCLMRGSVGEIVAAPGGDAFVNRFLDEAAAVAAKAGIAPREAFLASTRATLTTPGSPLTASMFRDLQGGGRIEADQIIGDLLDRGTKAGLALPLLSLTYTHLCVYQQRQAKR
jgi:2-dehydropantoate 2-reductase